MRERLVCCCGICRLQPGSASSPILRRYPQQPIEGDELMVVSGIDGWVRRKAFFEVEWNGAMGSTSPN